MLAVEQYVLAVYEIFEKFGGGETNKQGHIVEIFRSWANNVGRYRQVFTIQFNLIQ